jgi:hypothetical protein
MTYSMSITNQVNVRQCLYLACALTALFIVGQEIYMETNA